MDWETHIVLAGKLLEACALPKGAAIYSVLPVIDIEPIHYHRQYAHLLANQPLMVEIAGDIFATPECRTRDFPALRRRMAAVVTDLEAAAAAAQTDPTASPFEKLEARNRAYFTRRIAEDAEHFITTELAGAVKVLGPEAAEISTDRLAASLSLVSHTYFDTFNNPVGVFLPLAANYSAHWDLFASIDYLEYKASFYRPDVIRPFRRAMHDSDVWRRAFPGEEEAEGGGRGAKAAEGSPPYDAAALIKAMIQRLGALAPGISPASVEMAIRNFLATIGLAQVVPSDRELRFCRALEAEIRERVRTLFPRN
ncbi:MAG TPA: hypothetical protein VGT06_12670 [Candidatus Methylomirabilis sp.]|nr:hypothetical protein [Candidatus Methylomirabilis sp.]